MGKPPIFDPRLLRQQDVLQKTGDDEAMVILKNLEKKASETVCGGCGRRCCCWFEERMFYHVFKCIQMYTVYLINLMSVGSRKIDVEVFQVQYRES